MKDGWVKNTLRWSVKKLHQAEREKYVKYVREQARNLPLFTLFSSDCMAGLIYHTLGRKFLSPTINMSIGDSDFLKLMSDMNYYFNQDIVFSAWEKYPIGYLGEADKRIEIKFEHYHSNEDAANKWNERKRRIIDNQFIIMADSQLNDSEIESFKSLKCTRKVMFTWNSERADAKEIILIKAYNKPVIKNYSKLNIDGFRDYERFFDYVAWLDLEENFILER